MYIDIHMFQDLRLVVASNPFKLSEGFFIHESAAVSSARAYILRSI